MFYLHEKYLTSIQNCELKHNKYFKLDLKKIIPTITEEFGG